MYLSRFVIVFIRVFILQRVPDDDGRTIKLYISCDYDTRGFVRISFFFSSQRVVFFFYTLLRIKTVAE